MHFCFVFSCIILFLYCEVHKNANKCDMSVPRSGQLNHDLVGGFFSDIHSSKLIVEQGL